MRRSNSLLGLIGLVLILFAGVAAIFTRGNTTVDIVYIAANAIFGVFAVIAYLTAGVEQIRSLVGQRSTRYGTNVILSSALFLVILVIVNYLSARHNSRFDMTEQGAFSLSPQSVSVVKGLDKDLNIHAFVEGGISPELRDMLGTYAQSSDKVKFQMVDPDRQPELAEKYQIKQYNTVRFEYGEESTTITQPSEEQITNAIIKVTRTTRKTACVLEGHGEADIDDVQSPRGLASLKQALTNENYDSKKVLLASMAEVPSDCSVVIAATSERPYVESELAALGKYLDGGGRLMMMIPARTGMQFAPLLANWGVKLGDDVVVDQMVRLFQGPALGLSPLANTYGAHEITRDFKQRTVFPMTRSVKADAAGKEGMIATDLVKTSPGSWGETDLEGIFQRSEAVLDEAADAKGPVSVAVAIDANLKQLGKGDGNARLVVFGSADFAGNRELEGTYYNRDLIMNSLGWLVGQADLVSIRPRGIRASRVQFTADQGTLIFYLSVLVIPQLLLLVGLAVWWRRE